MPRAVRAAIERPVRLDAVADDHAAAMRTARRELVNRALETVERSAALRPRHLEGFVVVVSANIAFRHAAMHVQTRRPVARRPPSGAETGMCKNKNGGRGGPPPHRS